MPSIHKVSVRPVSLNQKTRTAAVFETLTNLITELDLPPGERLVEAELASRFQVSKTPIREALLMLVADGLVKLEPYHGARVTWLSFGEYRELVFLQDALEQAALPLVASQATTDELKAIGNLVEDLRRRRELEDSRGFFDVAVRIHEGLLRVVHSQRLVDSVLATLRPGRRYERVFVHQFPEIWDLELEIMVGRFENIRSGNPAAAVAHVQVRRSAMLELIGHHLDDPRVSQYLDPVTNTPPLRDQARAAPSPSRLIR